MTINGSRLKVVENKTWKVWLREDGILHAVMQPLAIMDLDVSQELVETYGKLSGHKGNLVLADLSNIKSTTKAAREYAASPASVAMIKAIALIIRSPTSQVIGNIFLRINQPAYPSRMFTSETEAIAWLNTHRA